MGASECCLLCGRIRGLGVFHTFSYGKGSLTILLSCMIRYNLIAMETAASIYGVMRNRAVRICKDHYVQTAFFLGKEIEQLLGHFPWNGLTRAPSSVMKEFLIHLRMYSSLVDDTVFVKEEDVVNLYNESIKKYNYDVVKEVSYADEKPTQETAGVSSTSKSARRASKASAQKPKKHMQSVCVGGWTRTSSAAEELMDLRLHVDDERASPSHDVDAGDVNTPRPFRFLALLKRELYTEEVTKGFSRLHRCMLCGVNRQRRKLTPLPTDPVQEKTFYSCIFINEILPASGVRFYKEKSKDVLICKYHYVQAICFIGAQARQRAWDKIPMDGLENLPYSTLKKIVERIRSYGIVEKKDDVSADDIVKLYQSCRSIYYPTKEADDKSDSSDDIICLEPPVQTTASQEAASTTASQEAAPTAASQEAASTTASQTEEVVDSGTITASQEEEVLISGTVDDEPLFLYDSEVKQEPNKESNPSRVEAENSAKVVPNGNSTTTRKRQASDQVVLKAKVKTEADESPTDLNDDSSSSEECGQRNAKKPVKREESGQSSDDGIKSAVMKSYPNKRFGEVVELLTPPVVTKKENTQKRNQDTLEKRIRDEQLLCSRLEICSSLYVRNRRSEFLDRIVVYEEKGILYDYIYRPPGRPSRMAKFECPEITTKRKVMLTVWWTSSGVILHKVLTSSPTKDGKIFTAYAEEMNKILHAKNPSLDEGPAPIYLYNSSCGYISNSLIHKLCLDGFECIPYPSDSPYLAPHAYFVGQQFGNYLSTYLINQKKVYDVNEAFCNFLKTIPPDFFMNALRELPVRWKKCIDSRGEILFP